MAAAYDHAGGGRVFGDEESGPKGNRVRTPDVAVDIGEDLVLMEVVGKVRRVWPVLVVAEGVLAAEPLWQHIEATHPDAFDDDRIEPLTIVNTFELELLMGLVEEGHALHDLLAKKTAGRYAKLPTVRWVYDEFPEGTKVRRASFVAARALPTRRGCESRSKPHRKGRTRRRRLTPAGV